MCHFPILASLLDNDLNQVEGLQDVRIELQSKREVS